MTHPIYLDYNGTTPHDPEVIKAMRPFFETEFGNPSSSHWYGIAPRRAVESARAQVASAINCEPEEILFTSGGTESNNHAIKSIARLMKDRGNHIITSGIEHPAVLEVCRFLETQGFQVTYLPVDDTGIVRISDVKNAICPETILISIMHANNETGAIQPIAEIGELAKGKNIIMHTDAAQSVGKISTNVRELNVSLLTIAGHKVYAPKGIGALYIQKPLKLEPFCHGAGQEDGRRAGTENVIEIVGLGKACEIALRDLLKNMAHMKRLRNRLHEGIASKIDRVRLNGHPGLRLPNTLNLSFYGLEANRILEEIGLEVAASAGAACHSDTVEISHVLTAMGVPEDWGKGTVRFSIGRMTTEAEIDRAIEVVVKAVQKLKSL
ncbi:MAG: cysteine desulfurase [Desulfobacteraceae bacterium]|nr:cysteine desulfurase [Desulfobacteraceae bacterium]MBC2756874.1 cysteine desulfurase [Desulfobacteraceae bacterium]